MSDVKDSGDAAFEEASTKLDEGLKTCRAVVENYRIMLASDQQSGCQSDGSAIALGVDASTPAIGNEELAVPPPE